MQGGDADSHMDRPTQTDRHFRSPSGHIRSSAAWHFREKPFSAGSGDCEWLRRVSVLPGSGHPRPDISGENCSPVRPVRICWLLRGIVHPGSPPDNVEQSRSATRGIDDQEFYAVRKGILKRLAKVRALARGQRPMKQGAERTCESTFGICETIRHSGEVDIAFGDTHPDGHLGSRAGSNTQILPQHCALRIHFGK